MASSSLLVSLPRSLLVRTRLPLSFGRLNFSSLRVAVSSSSKYLPSRNTQFDRQCQQTHTSTLKTNTDSAIPPLPTPSSEVASPDEQTPRPPSKFGLTEFSMIASILCAIDCTVLPVILGAIPMVDIASPESSQKLHHLLHQVSLYFVLPVGGAAVITNYFEHKQPKYVASGLSGLGLILAANGPWDVLPYEYISKSVYNTAGCAILLASQWFARKAIANHCCHGKSQMPKQPSIKDAPAVSESNQT
eukprot:GILK01013151.1.p1 GENE.GILK01013151.1~~GILK01013151.1.p1  ORF type:complete len:260 (-),score=19.66 GILK01013151.1:164-904(-)